MSNLLIKNTHTMVLVPPNFFKYLSQYGSIQVDAPLARADFELSGTTKILILPYIVIPTIYYYDTSSS